MKTSDFLRHRSLIFRRLGHICLLVAMLALAVFIAASSLPGTVRLVAALVIIVFTLVTLLRWELQAMRSYGLVLLPPGSGTLKTLAREGAGRFLSLSELGSRFKWESGGLLFGRPLPQHQVFGLLHHLWVGPKDDRHMLTVAGSRAGKGTAALIPNLLLYPGSALVIDPKGELAQITAARRGHGSQRVTECLGQDVFILDPEDIVKGLPTASWNPLAELTLSDPHFWGKVSRVGLAIVPPRGMKGEDEFFINQARDLLTALVVHVMTTEPPERHNLIYVRKLISQGDDELFDMVVDECGLTGNPVPYVDAFDALLHFIMQNKTQGGKISGIARQMIAMADTTRSSVVSTLSEQTSFLDQYAAEKMLQRSDFKLADLKLRPTTIYVCLKGTSLAGPLAKIMYILIDLAITAMEEIPGRPAYNVLFAMDEFYCLGRNESLDRAMGLMAGFGVTLWPLLQHMGQLKRFYPDTFDNFIRNCRAVQFFGDLDPDTLQYVEKRVGDRVLRRADGSLDRRPLLTSYELASSFFLRDARRQLLLFQQEPAALLQLIDYYKYFPKHWYDDDPRAQDRSHYSAWGQQA